MDMVDLNAPHKIRSGFYLPIPLFEATVFLLLALSGLSPS